MAPTKIQDSYIKGVLQQVHPGMKINKAAMDLIRKYLEPLADAFYNKILEGPVQEELNTLAFAALPGELSKHAIAEGAKAWNNYGENLLFKVNFSAAEPLTEVYANAVLEYMTAEILELSGNALMHSEHDTYSAEYLPKSAAISPKNVKEAIANDEELKEYVKDFAKYKSPAPVKKAAKRASRKGSRKGSRKASRKGSRKGSRKAARKGSRKGSRKAARKGSRRASRKTSRGRGFAGMTVAELKKKAKERGLRGYSTLKKDELVALLRSGKKGSVKKSSRRAAKKSSRRAAKKSSRKGTAKKDMTVVELRALCKKKGIKGYSGLRKEDLIKKCK